jgi:hypothetical protein
MNSSTSVVCHVHLLGADVRLAHLLYEPRRRHLRQIAQRLQRPHVDAVLSKCLLAGRITQSPRPGLGTLTAPVWPRWQPVPRADAYPLAAELLHLPDKPGQAGRGQYLATSEAGPARGNCSGHLERSIMQDHKLIGR